MTRGSKMSQIRKLLLRLPVSERRAVVRRAQISSVEGNGGQKSVLFHNIREDILCKLCPSDSQLIDNTSSLLRHADCLSPPPMAKGDSDKGVKGRNAPLRPINNFPTYAGYDGGIPDDPITLEIFSLRRRVLELSADVVNRNTKLTRALAELQSQKRYFRLLIGDNQGESYDQIQGRIRMLEGTIKYIEDPVAGPGEALEIPDRWKKGQDR